MGVTEYFRILKVNEKIEIHRAHCCDREYHTFFVSDYVKTDVYDIYDSDQYLVYSVYKGCFYDLKKLFDRMKNLLCDKDYELLLSRFEVLYCEGFNDDYNKWLAGDYNETIDEN